MLEFHSSSSGAVNTRRAVAECLENALGGTSLDCDLIIFYTTMGHDFGALLDEMRRLAPGARIAGCTCTGVIGREGPNESMRALAIMAIRGPRSEFAVAGRDKITKSDSYDVARGLAEDLKREAAAVSMVFFHPSGLGVFPEDAIRGIESVFGPDVPILGGLSADNLKFAGDFQFVDDRTFEQGAVAVGFADPTIGVVSRANHGYRVVGDPLLVTRSDRNRVLEIDGRRAWDAWAAAIGLPPTASVLELAMAPLVRELPPELREEYDSRYIHVLYYGSYGSAGGAIDASSACPAGTRLRLTKRDEKEIFAGTDRMVERIAQSCRGSRIVAVLQADCNARGRMLFNRVLKEEIVSRMQGPLRGDADVPWLGMYGGGEFVPLGGRNRIHAMTSALYVLTREA
jgi:hypothetical protein